MNTEYYHQQLTDKQINFKVRHGKGEIVDGVFIMICLGCDEKLVADKSNFYSCKKGGLKRICKACSELYLLKYV